MTLTQTPPPDLNTHRQRKKLATRRAIHEAAFDLVDRQGWSRATVEAISERAGIAPRTFWSYYSSKEDAVIDRDPELADRLKAELVARPAGEDAFTSLRAVLGGYLSDKVLDSDRAVRSQQLIRREPHLMAAVAALYDEIERSLTDALAGRLGLDAETDLAPGLMVTAACGAIRVAQRRWAAQKGRRPLAQLIDDAFDQLGAGLEGGR